MTHRTAFGLVDEPFLFATANAKRNDFPVLLSKEYFFVENGNQLEQHIVDGMNINFPDSLWSLQRSRPIVFTSERHKKQYIVRADRHVEVHNTGTGDLEVNHTFTVIPPLCAVPRSINLDGHYILQTVDLDSFKREFKILCWWLRSVSDIITDIGNDALTGTDTFWETIYDKFMNDMEANSLWLQLMEAVAHATELDIGHQVCRRIVLLAREHWSRLLGFHQDDGILYRPSAVTGRTILKNLVQGLREPDDVQIRDIEKINSDDENERNTAIRSLEQLTDSQRKIFNSLEAIKNYIETIDILGIGWIEAAPGHFVKPGDKMNVFLI